MASFYRSTVADFLIESEGEILAHLIREYARHGYTSQYTDQTLAWESDLRSLRRTFSECVKRVESSKDWGLLLEFSVPRKEMRIDAVILVCGQIVILESKASSLSLASRQQAEEYALLLHYFHKASNQRRIIPIVVSNFASESIPCLDPIRQRELFSQLAKYWIADVIAVSWNSLATVLIELAHDSSDQLNYAEWDNSPYFPVPSIIEAAKSLRTGLTIREIAHSEASEHEITAVVCAIENLVELAQTEKQYIICFVTGVPGSGKTLVGLSLAHSKKNEKA